MSLARLAVAAVAASTIATTHGGADARPSAQHDSLVVTTEWLAAHLADPSVVVLDAVERDMGEDSLYRRSHIPGARLLSSSDFSVQRNGLALELPPPAAIRDLLERLGISDSTRVVVYAEDPPTATRALFTFLYVGHARVSFLDGGLAKWRAEGRPVSQAVPSVTRGHITLRVHPEVVATADWVGSHSTRSGVSLIDTRTDGEYQGTGGRRGLPSGGHIAGARQLQVGDLFLDGTSTLVAHDSLVKLYARRVRPGDTVVTYCWIGHRASLTYLIARYLGYPARLYDGSYQDWSRRKLPVRAGNTP